MQRCQKVSKQLRQFRVGNVILIEAAPLAAEVANCRPMDIH